MLPGLRLTSSYRPHIMNGITVHYAQVYQIELTNGDIAKSEGSKLSTCLPKQPFKYYLLKVMKYFMLFTLWTC